MQTFTVRDLREHTGDVIHTAEAGKLSIITKHGRPAILALPFDQRLVTEGLNVALAIDLYQEDILSLAKAAKLAGVSLEEFMEKLSVFGIPVVDYDAEELDEELKNLE